MRMSNRKTCQWWDCTSKATTRVAYPGVVPGTAGRERSLDRTDYLHVCTTCALVARAEAAEMRRLLSDDEDKRMS